MTQEPTLAERIADLQSHEWVSYYTDLKGEWIKGTLRFTGDGGEYAPRERCDSPDAELTDPIPSLEGAMGRLRGVSYQQIGSLVSIYGEWEFREWTGWFHFRQVSPEQCFGDWGLYSSDKTITGLWHLRRGAVVDELNSLHAENERLRSYCGDEPFQSDYRTAAEMRAELERLRELYDRARAERATLLRWIEAFDAVAAAVGIATKDANPEASGRQVIAEIAKLRNELARLNKDCTAAKSLSLEVAAMWRRHYDEAIAERDEARQAARWLHWHLPDSDGRKAMAAKEWPWLADDGTDSPSPKDTDE